MAYRFSKREKTMVGALAAIVVVYLLYFQLYQPVASRLSGIDSEIEAARMQLMSMRHIADTVEKNQAELDDLNSRLDAIWQTVGRDEDIPWLLWTLDDAAKSTDTALLNFKPLPIKTGKYAAMIQFELNLQGSFDNITAFCRDVETTQPAISLNSIKVDAAKSQGLLGDSMLNVVVSGSTYFRKNASEG